MNISTITRHETAVNIGGFETIYFIFQKDVTNAKKQKINIDNRNTSIFGMLETAEDTELLTLYYTPKSVDFKESSQISRNGKVYNNSLTARIPQDREEVASTLQAVKNNKVFIVFKDRNGKIKQIKNNRLTETLIINTNDNHCEISLSGQSKEKSKFLSQTDFDYFIELQTMTDSFEVTTTVSGQSIKVFAEARALNNVITTETVSLPIGTSKIRGRKITRIEKITASVAVNINKPLPTITILNVSDTLSNITDTSLSMMPSLTQLRLFGSPSTITNAGLVYVPNLLNLLIHGTLSLITDSALAYVPKLTQLYVSNTNSNITNAGLVFIPKLTILALHQTPSSITNSGLLSIPLLVNFRTSNTTSVITAVTSIVKTIDVSLSSNTAANNDTLMLSIIAGGATNGTLKMTGYTNAASLATLQGRGWIVTT